MELIGYKFKKEKNEVSTHLADIKCCDGENAQQKINWIPTHVDYSILCTATQHTVKKKHTKFNF